MLPPSRYYLISKLIYVLVCLLNGRLSDVDSLCNLLAALLLSRELSHHEESDSSYSLRLSTCSNLQISNSLGHRASSIVDVHWQIQLISCSISYLSGIQNHLVL